MSQIATTIEQSVRLLDAGLDPGSADMSWVTIDTPWRKESKTTDVLTLGNPVPHRDTPAWSLSRLIDISKGCLLRSDCRSSSTMIENLVDNIEFLISSGEIDSKYLKDANH